MSREWTETFTISVLKGKTPGMINVQMVTGEMSFM